MHCSIRTYLRLQVLARNKIKHQSCALLHVYLFWLLSIIGFA